MNNTDNSNKTEVPKGSISLHSAVRWYMLGFALLGGAVGFFAGSSQSPVIGTLLPLLFGLIGGAGDEMQAHASLREQLQGLGPGASGVNFVQAHPSLGQQLQGLGGGAGGSDFVQAHADLCE